MGNCPLYGIECVAGAGIAENELGWNFRIPELPCCNLHSHYEKITILPVGRGGLRSFLPFCLEGREILFGGAEQEVFMELLFSLMAFSGLMAAWCFMGNHFHLLLEVPDKERALAG